MYTATKRIASLREQGWKVKVRMERVLGETTVIDGIPITTYACRHETINGGRDFNAKGGKTIVTLFPPNGDDPFVGISWCHTEKDNFNRKVGLEAAFGRAWQAYEKHGT
jgi:hypothetical protein